MSILPVIKIIIGLTFIIWIYKRLLGLFISLNKDYGSFTSSLEKGFFKIYFSSFDSFESMWKSLDGKVIEVFNNTTKVFLLYWDTEIQLVFSSKSW